MLPDRVSNPGPLTYESGALPIALRGPASPLEINTVGKRLHAKECFYFASQIEIPVDLSVGLSLVILHMSEFGAEQIHETAHAIQI